ncbi:MAG: DegV family protein [Oscillospiraceae bacterium]|jgi:DegV family protein with EDD domain|nr:DegV family protein [Oscillospiraceae bacterium]
MSVKIIADSTCDLAPETLARLDVSIVPLYVTLDDKSYRDGLDLTPEGIYRFFAETKRTPRTSAVSVWDFLQVMAPVAEEGREIVYISISSDLSTSFQNAEIAAREFPQTRIRAVDSRSLSTGVGLLVLKAARMAREGRSADEIANELTRLCDRVHASFLVDSIDFLYRGGRCNALEALGANLLRLRPSLVLTGGRIEPGVKYRGSLVDCVRKYTLGVLAEMQRPDPSCAFITHTKMDPALVDTVRELVANTGHFREICETTAGCVITSHCGENTLGVLYMELP